jgi:transposase
MLPVCLFVCACEPKPYPSGLTDAQWELIAAMVQPRPGGRPATYARRRIVDAILYLNRIGCSRRQLPHDFPPWETVYWFFKVWNEDGVTDRIHDALRAAVRDAAGRDPMASAGIVDAQSVEGADTVGAAVRGLRRGQEGQWPLSRARNATSVTRMTAVGNPGLSVVDGITFCRPLRSCRRFDAGATCCHAGDRVRVLDGAR